jgi:hypothetical protein
MKGETRARPTPSGKPKGRTSGPILGGQGGFLKNWRAPRPERGGAPNFPTDAQFGPGGKVFSQILPVEGNSSKPGLLSRDWNLGDFGGMGPLCPWGKGPGAARRGHRPGVSVGGNGPGPMPERATGRQVPKGRAA